MIDIGTIYKCSILYHIFILNIYEILSVYYILFIPSLEKINKSKNKQYQNSLGRILKNSNYSNETRQLETT